MGSGDFIGPSVGPGSKKWTESIKNSYDNNVIANLQTILTSRDIKEYQNPSMTKSYSVGFIFMLNWRTKKGSQKIKIFYAQNSSNLISSDNFGAKTQETDC